MPGVPLSHCSSRGWRPPERRFHRCAVVRERQAAFADFLEAVAVED
jgi:hypothetical protein